MPTRNARNGHLFVTDGVVKIAMRSIRAILAHSILSVIATPSQLFTRLLASSRPLQRNIRPRLNTIHNLRYYQRLMAGLRRLLKRVN